MSNSLIYKTDKVVGQEHIFVKIRLNDECKNGHQDFSITGDIYEAGKPKVDRYCIAGGCIHDDIAKHFPEFQRFIDLHLCDYDGVPMHASANMRYHMRQNSMSKDEFCKYYRITPKQFDKLSEAKNEIHFTLLLESLGVLSQWNQQAQEAIKVLEDLTGQKFENNSTRSNYKKPTPEQVQEFENQVKSVYFTAKAIKQRERQKALEILNKKIQDVEAEINNRKNEIATLKEIFRIGGLKALNNCIFYNHSQELALNWKTYEPMLTPDEVETIKSKAKLPAGVKIELAKQR